MMIHTFPSASRPFPTYDRDPRRTLPPWVAGQLRKVVRRLYGAPLGGNPRGHGPEEAQLVDRVMIRLRRLDPTLADLLDLRIFQGYSEEQTAAALGLDSKRYEQDWRRARLWFYRYLQQEVVASTSTPC